MDTLAILDFGSQYAHLIADRIRRLKVHSEIFPADVLPEKLKSMKGIILSGGPQSVHAEGGLKCDPAIFDLNIPVLGICYGHQVMNHLLGGRVQTGKVGEYGKATLHVHDLNNPLTQGLDAEEPVWMSHFDEVVAIPETAKALASTDDGQYPMVDFGKNRWSIQFHAEVTHTPHGMKILDNFLNICNAKREWSMDRFLELKIKEIQTQAEGKKVFLLISGGVDSTVTFLLLEKALGNDRVYGLFVDHGLMRKDEGASVKQLLEKIGVKNLRVYDGAEEFIGALKEAYDPEVKRRIIGDKFLEVQRHVTKELGLNPDEWLLGQGTIYPDTIESGGTKHADKIKTHHNRVPEIEELIRQGRVIEPVKDLYKDEVREVGEKLGLSPDMVWRHPFPGPGLGVRCLCVKEPSPLANAEKLEQEIDVFLQKNNTPLLVKVLPVKSVGVQGDVRSYRHPVVLSGQAEWSQLEAISPMLTNRFLDLNRVLLFLGQGRVDTVRSLPNYITKERLAVLQEADAIVNQMLFEKNLLRDIWQFPVVLLPLEINERPGETIVLRPVSSTEAMTANFYPMDKTLLHDLTQKIQALPGISAVLYDITNKPPGTIEWE
ncbi:MAG: glutamine-hydrolyzing GMP synthase [Candidatus Gracilibacteria bacterium]